MAMRERASTRVIFSVALLAPFSACGPASTGNSQWTNPDGASFSSSSSGGGAANGEPEAGVAGNPNQADAGAPIAADGSPGASPDGGRADATGAIGADGSTAPRDASTSKDAGAGAIPGDGGVLPYKGVANSACADLATLGASWYYNWTLTPASCTTPPFVPMIWGHTGAEQTASGVAKEIGGIVSAGYATVLGFNEPDNTGQSNLSVATAISLWPSFNNPSLRIGSPATQGNATGVTWITSFMNQVNADTTGQLRVDFIATHWYGWNAGSCDANGASLEAYIRQIEAIPGNRPIWLTEWGCLNQSNPTAAVVQAFFSGAITMLAKHPRVERYAWYPWTTNNELVANGGLTALGTAFAGAPATR
jgi:Glycosyl hydrolase catalytic core